ncbi:thiamine pyrophosphate-binding protein [Streptomyces sp. NBC_01104]|uniref:thiamine pyrophosphate-binding protein n=1 Tax=Streptomyces sp. NBC_01104 TaxID=2903750 RepID=UPI00386E8BE5|nr:thiamine pyrophosphate-binding protein [Streptomyces sp. NBC_01104]
MTPPNGGDLLVETLRGLGVDTVFGIVSVHNLPLVEAVDRDLRFVPVRHEAAAVNAADGYARATGSLGCALTSTGTGAGNAAGSLIESLSSGTPVLHITGQIDSEHLGSGRGFIHETKDQLGMLRAVSTHAVTVTDAADAGDILRDAAARALTAPHGPVSVEWPIDLQFAPQQLTGTPVPKPAVPALPDPALLDEAAALLSAARRPLVWAGGGANSARPELAALLDALNAGLVTSNSGRGSVPESDDRVLGNYATAPAGRALLAEADVLLSIGTHFRSNETADYSLGLPPVHIQLDLDPAAPGRVYPATCALHGDAATVLAALLGRVTSGGTETSWPDRVRRARTDARTAQRHAIGPQAAVNDAIRDACPPGSVIARDVTIPSSTWGNRLLEITDPATNVFPRGGGIGQGLAMGIGAALGRPSTPTVVIAGDGGLAVHLGELLTLAQEKPDLTLLVFNDGGYGVLRNMQDNHFPRRSGVDLTTPDFALLAAAVGLPYARIAAEADAGPVIRAATASPGPTLVEIDLAALGPMNTPFTPPVKLPATATDTSGEGGNPS